MSAGFRWKSLVLLALLLAGCARTGRVERVDDDARWRLEGRLAVSDGRESGTGTLLWEQDGPYFMISLRAPVSGQSWRLSGDAQLCSLEGLKPYPLTASSPELLLERELGWHLPVKSLRRWLRGEPADADTAVERNEDGEVVGFSEDGWVIRFTELREGRPVRVTARKPPYQVRLAIKSWVVLP